MRVRSVKNIVCAGMTVRHKTYGNGTVVYEWGPILAEEGKPNSVATCEGIVDVIFQNRSGYRFLHCCRKEHLTLLGILEGVH